MNTAIMSGVIRRLEESFGRPLQWLACMLLVNELSLRHIFIFLYGSTTRPRGFSGPIEKACLCVCNILQGSLNQFILQTLESKDLSSDQRYLREMCDAVDNGNCPIDIAARNPGILN